MKGLTPYADSLRERIDRLAVEFISYESSCFRLANVRRSCTRRHRTCDRPLDYATTPPNRFPRTRRRATSFTIATAFLLPSRRQRVAEHREDPHRPSFPVAEKLARLSPSFIPPNSA